MGAGGGFGRYELVERLAVRAASELFVVRISGEAGFRRHVVLKRLRDDAHANDFIEDAKLQAKLSHSKIVQTLELGRVGDAPYVATEYVDGVDLLGLLAELARLARPMDPPLAVWIAQELLDALDYAHTLEGVTIVHGRLSPSKVLLGEQGEVKLCDFAVTRQLEIDHAGLDYGHMSPEQVMEQPFDARSDVFAAGILLAEMLTGRRLFAAHNELDVLMFVRDAQIDRFDCADGELAAIVRKALARKPSERWQTAAAFRDALDAWMFARRYHAQNQQLATLVSELRAAIDKWRAGKRETPHFDARDAAVFAPPERKLVIPAKGSTGMKPLDRQPGVGTIDPLARGTERPQIARGSAAVPPLAKPRRPRYLADPIPALPRSLTQRARTRGQSEGELGQNLEGLLPARAPSEPAQQTTQLLTPDQLAKSGQPPPPMLAQVERTPDDAGDFDNVSPLRVLFGLMRARATGLLVVTVDGLRKDVYVRDGQIAGVWSNDARDLFGNYLVAQHVLSDGELSMALATMQHYGGRIGDTLVGLGLLTLVEVFRHLTRHARGRVVEICGWDAGHYTWFGGEDRTVAFPLEQEGFSVLGEAAVALPGSIIDPWIAKHRDVRVTFPRVHRLGPEIFGVKGAANVLDLVDGTRTVGAIIGRHTDRAVAARLLYLFVATDFARL